MTILCPTCGGDESVPNQEAAIDLALKRNARLVFLYVSNIHFLDYTAGPLDLEVIEKQLDEVGDFILTMVEERSRAKGVEADALVKRGDFRAALVQVIIEKPDIKTVVFGSAIEGSGAITPDYIQPLYDHLVNELGVEVLVTRNGGIVEEYRPDSSAEHTSGPEEQD